MPALQAAPDTVFFGGPIITLDGDDRVAEALAIRDGRVAALGSAPDILALADANTRRIDLAGAALLPGFFDSHSHANFIGLQALSANLLPAPDGTGNSIGALQAILRKYLAGEPRLLEDTGWLIGFGYDDSQLLEQRHPTRHDLDAVSAEVPILVIHQSGHLGAVNSAGLRAIGIDAATPDPDGGAFRREDDSAEPNGVAEEYAFFRLIFSALAGASDSLKDDMLLAGTRAMASFGYTTAQEGRASPDTLAVAERLAARDLLPIDLVAYPDILTVDTLAPTGEYHNRYRVGGVKLTIDGSPQGKTAWLTEPYHVPPAGQGPDYRGYPAIDAATSRDAVLRAFAQGWQILVHANGDAAIDALLEAVRAARAAHPGARHAR